MIWKPKYKVGQNPDGTPQYKKSKFFWMEFSYCGNLIRQSTKQTKKTLAKDVEDGWRTKLKQGLAGLDDKPINQALTFETAANEYMQDQENRMKIGKLSPSSLATEKLNLTHILPVFGKKMLIAIRGRDFLNYQVARQQEKRMHFHPTTKQRICGKRLASNGTINLELATFRAIMIRNGHWNRMQGDKKNPDIEELDVQEVGRAISKLEEEALLKACQLSTSKCLYPFILCLLETGSRFGTSQRLRWCDIDFQNRELTFGKDKTRSGSGRIVPLSHRLLETLKFWASEFPHRKSTDFVFPHMRYKGNKGSITYDLDVNRPFNEIKTAWEKAKLKAAQILANDVTVKTPIKLRFHDLRHTAVTRMLGAGIPLQDVAKIVGWSASRTAQMVELADRYNHTSKENKRRAVEAISGPPVFQPQPEQLSQSRPN